MFAAEQFDKALWWHGEFSENPCLVAHYCWRGCKINLHPWTS